MAVRAVYLSRVWGDLAHIAMRRSEPTLALKYLQHASEADAGKALSTDQRLGLWISQSACYRALQQYDHAMRMLSKVINSDAISSLRIKAMFLRAEVYELQDRPELAAKQLDACRNKGGAWAVRAQTKLNNEYSYE